VSLPVGWSAPAAPATWFQIHAPWVVPASLLLISVLVLGIVWHRQQPAVEFPELRIEQASDKDARPVDDTAADRRPAATETELPR
jgi:hypothetical protein